MRLVVFESAGRRLIGALEGEEITALTANPAPEDLMAGRLPAPGGERYAVRDVTFLPPLLTPPRNLLCLGLNYPDPAASGARPDFPILFLKTLNTLTGHRQPVVIPRASRQIDYEGELCVLIGRRARHISPAEALDYVAGYTIANDIGARDLQARSSQWATGKLCDTFTPVGPALVTRDELLDPAALPIRTTLNGELVQEGGTHQMFFDVPFTLAYLAGLMTLEPGDLILMGSPKAVGDAPAPRHFLTPGSLIRVDMGPLGVLENPVSAE